MNYFEAALKIYHLAGMTEADYSRKSQIAAVKGESGGSVSAKSASGISAAPGTLFRKGA